jgi:hypothetical protein
MLDDDDVMLRAVGTCLTETVIIGISQYSVRAMPNWHPPMLFMTILTLIVDGANAKLPLSRSAPVESSNLP